MPTIAGEFTPYPDSLAVFDGESHSGSWTLTVMDQGGGDSGTLWTWCVDKKQVGGDCGVPSTTTVGAIVMILLLLGTSGYFLRRRTTD